MMKLTLLTAAFTLFTAIGFSQVTTDVEYKYIRNGIPDDEDKGRDVKGGYTLKEIGSVQTQAGKYIFTFKKLSRTTDQSLAGTYIRIINKGGSFEAAAVYYLCLPAPDTKTQTSYGWQDFYQDLDKLSCDIKTSLLKYLSYKASMEIIRE